MKTLSNRFHALLFALALVSFAVGAGCTTSTSSSSGGAYALKQTRDNVDWAMTRYRNRLEFGFVTTEEQEKVTTAYKAYQSAFNKTAKAMDMNLDARTPATVKDLADKVIDALDSIP